MIKLKATDIKDCVGKKLTGYATSKLDTCLLLVFEDGSLLEASVDSSYDDPPTLELDDTIFAGSYELKNLVSIGAISDDLVKQVMEEEAKRKMEREERQLAKERRQYEELKKKFEGQQ